LYVFAWLTVLYLIFLEVLKFIDIQLWHLHSQHDDL
jgi:hypothetical protein